VESKIEISNKLGVRKKKAEGQMIALEMPKQLCLWV